MGKNQLFLHKIIQKFKTEADRIFQNHIVALIVYGSAVTDEYVHRQSDINILVVLDEKAIANLEAANEKIHRWYDSALSPLFLTESYINRSLDSFPIEFINMQSAYHVVEGKDVLQPLEFVDFFLELLQVLIALLLRFLDQVIEFLLELDPFFELLEFNHDFRTIGSSYFVLSIHFIASMHMPLNEQSLLVPSRFQSILQFANILVILIDKEAKFT